MRDHCCHCQSWAKCAVNLDEIVRQFVERRCCGSACGENPCRPINQNGADRRDSPLPVVTGILDNLSPLGKQSSPLRVSPLQTQRPERHPSEVSEDEPVKDEELDRLRTSLFHAYDPPRPLTQRLAKAVKDRITLAKKANDKTAAVKTKGKDAA